MPRGGNRTSLGHCTLALAPTQHPTMYDIVWAAGIYEGEGHCSWSKSVHICVSQKDTWLLEKLKHLFGGNIYYTHKTCKQWVLTGARARGFAYTVFTFLSPRRRKQITQQFLKDKKLAKFPRG